MRYLVGMFLVLALCAAGCTSTLTMRSGGVQYEREGLGEIDPVAVSTAGYIDARADTERAWGEVLLTEPETALGYLERIANPWRRWGYGQQGVGQTDPYYYLYGTQIQTVAAPAGGVR